MTTTISGSTGVNQITDDAITDAKLPAGSVLQVVEASDSTHQTTSAAAWIDTNLSVAITPSSTASKVHIHFSVNSVYFAAVGTGCSFRILRDSTSLYTPSLGHAIYTSYLGAYYHYADIAVDSPATTSSVTYKIQVRSHNSNAVQFGATQFKNTLILMEIAG